MQRRRAQVRVDQQSALAQGSESARQLRGERRTPVLRSRAHDGKKAAPAVEPVLEQLLRERAQRFRRERARREERLAQNGDQLTFGAHAAAAEIDEWHRRRKSGATHMPLCKINEFTGTMAP